MAIRFDKLELAGSTNHAFPTLDGLSHGTNVRIQTQHGAIDIGAGNSSYGHFTTDRASFYFNAAISFDGDLNAYGGTENIQSFNNVDAAKFRDKSDTSYYLDPNSNSILNQVSFGIPAAGSSTKARFFSIEGNADGSGEGSGRIFFSEHNSSTAAKSKYGMSLGYRGGSTSIVGTDGNTWTGLSDIGNGQWGMWGHDNSAPGSLIMYGDRAATFVNFAQNSINNTGDITGKSVNNAYSLLYKFGGLFFTWDSDSYGTNVHHSIRSTYGNTFTDSITLNSFNHIRFNIDSNDNNSTSYFEVGDGGTHTSNVIFRVNQAGNANIYGNQLSVGDSTQTTTSLNLTATNTDGAPANAIEINMSGYEGRAQGIFHEDSAHSGEKWFSGLIYAGNFDTWQVGFHGTQPQYAANYVLKVDTGGNLSIKGDIYIGNDDHADTKLVYKTGGFIEVDNGSIRSMTFVDSGYTHMHKTVCFHGVSNATTFSAWDETTQGTLQGTIHLDPDSTGDHHGCGITFGASDTGNGITAQAGIYTRTDGSYGTKMYFSTTNSYATGSKTAMRIEHDGKVYVTRGNLFLQNVDTASSSENTALFLNGSTGEVEKRELGAGAFGSGAATDNTKLPLTGGTMTGTIDSHRNDTQTILLSGNSSASNADQFKLNHSYGNVEIRNLRGNLNLFPTSTVNLGYGTAIKLATVSGGVSVTGSVTASSTIGNLDTTNDIGQQLEKGDANAATLRCDANRWRVYMGGSGNSQETLTVTEDGRVGVKDSTPSYKLDVAGTIRATGDVIAYSDERVKENIKTIDNSLEKVNKLRGVEFNKIGEDKKSIGVIAQEIEKIIPEVVRTDDEGMKSVAYGNVVGVLI